MSAPDPTLQAKDLWTSAHEHVRRGDLAAATRDLSGCYQILQALKDPRITEVHKRWIEVHKLYLEEGARAASPTPKPAPAPTVEAEAEAAANAGNLEQAILLYEQALQKQPENELVTERLVELRAARPRAAELTEKRPELLEAQVEEREVLADAEMIVDVPASNGATALVDDVPAANGIAAALAEDSFADINEPEGSAVAVAELAVETSSALATAESASIHEATTLVPELISSAPDRAHVMPATEAGVGLPSIDVDIDMGDAVSAAIADDMPIDDTPPAGQPSPPAALATEDAGKGAPQPAAALTAEDPRWGAGQPAAGLSAEDPRWGASDPLPPSPAASSVDGAAVAADVALLEELLARVQTNRRSRAA